MSEKKQRAPTVPTIAAIRDALQRAAPGATELFERLRKMEILTPEQASLRIR